MTGKNLDLPIVDINGKPLPKDTGGETLVKDIAVSALFGQYADEQALSGDEKFRRFKLAMTVNDGGSQDLSPEDVVLIKKLVGKAYGPLIVGQVYNVLNA